MKKSIQLLYAVILISLPQMPNAMAFATRTYEYKTYTYILSIYNIDDSVHGRIYVPSKDAVVRACDDGICNEVRPLTLRVIAQYINYNLDQEKDFTIELYEYDPIKTMKISMYDDDDDLELPSYCVLYVRDKPKNCGGAMVSLKEYVVPNSHVEDK